MIRILPFVFVVVFTLLQTNVSYASQEIHVDNTPYASIELALKAIHNGSHIFFPAGIYASGIQLTQNNLLIEGESGTIFQKAVVKGKATFVLKGNNTWIKNIECRGVSVPDNNGACIRLEGKGLTVSDVYFHTSQQGILTSHDVGDIMIENSRFVNLGYKGRAHGIYTNCETLTIVDSVFLNAKSEGHEIKSRCKKTVIKRSIIASIFSNDSRLIDIPNSGELDISDSLLQQGVGTKNRQLIGFGQETKKQQHIKKSIKLTNNIIINDHERVGYLLGFSGKNKPNEIIVEYNKIVGNFSELTYSDSNKIYPNRKKAELPKFPFLPTINQLPCIFDNYKKQQTCLKKLGQIANFN